MGYSNFTGSKSYMITVELHEISKANRVSENIEKEIVDIATQHMDNKK